MREHLQVETQEDQVVLEALADQEVPEVREVPEGVPVVEPEVRVVLEEELVELQVTEDSFFRWEPMQGSVFDYISRICLRQG